MIKFESSILQYISSICLKNVLTKKSSLYVFFFNVVLYRNLYVWFSTVCQTWAALSIKSPFINDTMAIYRHTSNKTWLAEKLLNKNIANLPLLQRECSLTCIFEYLICSGKYFQILEYGFFPNSRSGFLENSFWQKFLIYTCELFVIFLFVKALYWQ